MNWSLKQYIVKSGEECKKKNKNKRFSKVKI